MSPSDRRQFLQQLAGGVAALVLPREALPAPVRRPSGAPLPVGVVGVGKQGRQILAELAKFEQVQVKAVCDPVESRRRAALRRAPDAQAFERHAELLRAGVEAVFVATPSHRHREVVADCLASGKHVYCEAPLASAVEDLTQIAGAVDAAGVIFQSGHTARSNPVYQLARSFLLSGAIRDVVVVRAQSHQKNSWRAVAAGDEDERAANWRLYRESSAGLPGELGSHQFDAVLWFLGRVPVAVRGAGSIRAYHDDREVPDTVSCRILFPEALEMYYEATLCNSFEGDHEVFGGTMGTIKMAQGFGWLFKEADAPTQGWEVYASRERFHNEEGITLIADATKLAAQGKLEQGIGLPDPPLYYALQDFLKSVLEGKEVACGIRDGVRAATLGIRCHEAVLAGTEVPLSLEGS